MTQRCHHQTERGCRSFHLPSVGPLLLICLLLHLLSRHGGCLVSALDFRHHSNEEVHAFLMNVTKAYPDITRLYSIGRSQQGRELWVLAVGESPTKPVLLRPNVKYVANMHGNEVVGRELLLHLAEHLVTGYGRDSNVTRLLNTTTVHLLPSLNPDGYQVANTTDCKGLQGRYNANNLDLNRNFPDYFQKNSASIQAETRAVMDWLRDCRFVLSANLHGGALVASYPFDTYGGELRGPRESPSPDDDVFQHLARVYSYNHGTMRTHRPCDPEDPVFKDGITNGAWWYTLTGGMQDYNYIRGSCYEMTLELSCCKYPPASELFAFWEENKRSLLLFLEQVHMGVKGLVLDDNNNPVPDAQVVIKGRELVPFNTSRFGEYFKLLLPGKYTLVVSKPGVSTQMVPFDVISGTVTRINVTLGDGVATAGNRQSGHAVAVVLVVIWVLDLSR